MITHDTADEIKRKIYNAEMEMRTAGPCHRRDLLKHIHRMQKELLIYDRYQQAARVTRERTAVAKG